MMGVMKAETVRGGLSDSHLIVPRMLRGSKFESVAFCGAAYPLVKLDMLSLKGIVPVNEDQTCTEY